MNDSYLIELLFKRDERALREIETKYGAQILKLAARILGNESEAEECLNDTLLAVWNNIPPQEPRSLEAYILRAARNKAINMLNRKKASKRNCVYDVCIDELAESLPSNENVEELIEAAESGKHFADMINTFLSNLSEAERVLFLKRYWHFEEISEIAAETGLRRGAVRTRLSRIRAKLKKQINEIEQ